MMSRPKNSLVAITATTVIFLLVMTAVRGLLLVDENTPSSNKYTFKNSNNDGNDGIIHHYRPPSPIKLHDNLDELPHTDSNNPSLLVNKRSFDVGTTSRSEDHSFSEEMWSKALTSAIYLNYTFYLSSSGSSSSTTVPLPNCTLVHPCSTIDQVMKAIDGSFFTKTNINFINMFGSIRYVVVNVIVLDDMEVVCDLSKNSFVTTPIPNLYYMMRFNSFNTQERRTLACIHQGYLFQTTRPDLFIVLFAHINLRYIVLTNEYVLNFGMHHSAVLGMNLINTDAKFAKNVFVEYCKLEYFGISYTSSVDVMFLNSELKTLNTFKLNSIVNAQMVDLDVSGALKADFSDIRQFTIAQSRLINHSTIFFMTNTLVVNVIDCHIERQESSGVIFTLTKGNDFQFVNNIVRENMVVFDVKAYDRVLIVNSTFSENRILEDKFEKFDLFFNYNSPMNVRTTSFFTIVNSTFDNNYGTKGSHSYVADVIDFQVHNSKFLNGIGSALFIDTSPSTDINRFLINVQNSLFENNISKDYGGALRILYSIQLVLNNCIFRNNVAEYSGGAVNVVLANMINLKGTLFERNRVLFEGRTPDEEYFHRGTGGAFAIHRTTGPLEFGGASFIENEAYAGGAFFFSFAGFKQISDSVFRKNKAKNTGGAILHFAPSNFEVTKMVNVEFDQNSASVFGDDYFTSVNALSFEFKTLSMYPGQTIYFPMKTSAGNISVPCYVDRYIVSDSQYPNIYFHLQELKDGLNITLLILNGTISDYFGIIFNNTIKVSQTFDKGLFSSATVLPCPERYQYQFTNMFDTPAFACVQSSALTWKEIITIAIPAGVAFFIMGGFTGLITLYLCLSITRRLRRLSTKEKAEKAIAQKIIDKRIVFGSDYEPTGFNDTHYYDTLSYPLLASNEVEMAISRRVKNFLIPIEALEIVSKIAEGGQGVVYKALLYGKTTVALKSLKQFLIDGNDGNDTEEFEKEVSILASLKHENILKFHGISVTDDSKYMVTEYLENGSLERMIYKCRIGNVSLTLKQKLIILQDICSGLEYLHSLEPPIVHRDLKPGNVLFDSDFKCKICDFGLSRAVGNLNSNNTMTKNIGTFLYSSPESWTESSAVGSSQEKIVKATKVDVFSFGIMMYELFFEISPYSQCAKVGGSSGESISPINILAHIVKGNRPLIPFDSLDQVKEWLQIYPSKPYELNFNLCQIVLDYFKLATQCWSQHTELRPSIKEVSDELKRLTFELSAHCE